MQLRKERIALQNLLSVAQGTVGSVAHQRFYTLTREGKRGDVLGGGKLSCAVVLSRILLCVWPDNRPLCRGPHTTIHGLTPDILACGWNPIARARWHKVPPQKWQAGWVLLWEKKRGNAHIGLCLGNGVALSNCRLRRVPVIHPCLTESDGKTPRAVVRVLEHPALRVRPHRA